LRLTAALLPRLAESLRLSGQFGTAKPQGVVDCNERRLDKTEMLAPAPRADFFNDPMTQDTSKGFKIHRRRFLQTAATASYGFSLPALGQVATPKAGTVRDRLWIFCNPVNADYDAIRHRSVMSPCEGAIYLGIPNILMVNQYPEGRPGTLRGEEGWSQPWEPPLEQYAIPLKMLKRVVWSIVDAGGVTKDSERRQVLEMAHRIPNFVGVYMDDFFKGENAANPASLTLDQLRAVQRELKGPGKKLDSYVTFYTQFLNRPFGEYLKLIDVITLWTGHVQDLQNLDANLALLEKLAPKSRKMLGLYQTDYNEKRVQPWIGMPVEAMQHQCEAALRALRDGRIEGIIFYGCTVLDQGFKSVDWARNWIQKVGDTKL